MKHDTAFEMATSNIRFGKGITGEIGKDLVDQGLRHVMVLTDPLLARLKPVEVVLDSLTREGVGHVLYDQVRTEPTDESFHAAISFAQSGDFDSFVAVGGGSTIDTAKAANLYSTYPADFLDYVNIPIGKGLPVPGPLKPLFAIPTTAGTGSETTGVSIFDLVSMHAKTGIAHRRLKPTLGILDPENTESLPPGVAASTGLDVLSHAIESYTVIPFTERPYPERPILRPSYQGANPISDVWSLRALKMVVEYLPRAINDPHDEEARGQMLLASSYAGIGFGNAGVHLPHGMSYAVSGMVKDFHPTGYQVGWPMVPHGISVILNSPAAFRFTASACPERHLIAAEILGADVSKARREDAGRILSERVIAFMQSLGMPNGLSGVGYSESDIPALVQGTLPQHRLTKLSPRPVGEEDFTALFKDALHYW
jgi:hydroxyacid-oxoacid transhydrogenase